MLDFSGVGNEDSKTTVQLKYERLTGRLQLIKVGTERLEQVLETYFNKGTEGTTNRLLKFWI